MIKSLNKYLFALHILRRAGTSFLKNEDVLWKHNLHLEVVYREFFILQRCKGKNVLHVGFVDFPLTIERVLREELFHLQLKKVCNILIGIDNQLEAVSTYQKLTNDKDVMVGDIYEFDKVPINFGKFDIILVSEVIEHLSNPGIALQKIRNAIVYDTEVLITVPNSYRYAGFISALNNIDYVHPDHKAYYSPHSLIRLLYENNFEPFEIYMYLYGNKEKVTDPVFLKFPIIADGIIAVCKKQ